MEAITVAMRTPGRAIPLGHEAGVAGPSRCRGRGYHSRPIPAREPRAREVLHAGAARSPISAPQRALLMPGSGARAARGVLARGAASGLAHAGTEPLFG